MIELLQNYKDITGEFDWEEYLANPNHIKIRHGNDVALFSYEYPGLYTGHYFFESRGKEALRLSREILHDIFTNHPVVAIRGLTPDYQKGARWMSRQLGFKSYGMIETPKGLCEFFLLSREDYKGMTNE